MLLPIESEAPQFRIVNIMHVWYLWFQVGLPPTEHLHQPGAVHFCTCSHGNEDKYQEEEEGYKTNGIL